MPAKYTLVLRKDMRKGAAEDSKLYYANAKAAGTCGMYELCDLISLSSTASPGDVRLILDSLIEVMKRPGKVLRDSISNYSFEKIPEPSDTTGGNEGGGGEDDRPVIE